MNAVYVQYFGLAIGVSYGMVDEAEFVTGVGGVNSLGWGQALAGS